MALVIVFGIMQMSINKRHMSSSLMNISSASQIQARNFAHSGLELAIHNLNSDEWSTGETYTYLIDGNAVTIQIEEDIPGEVTVFSTGEFNGMLSTSVANLLRNPGGDLPEVTAAVMVMNDDFTISSPGNSWLIQGRNTLPASYSSGSAGGTDLPGISATTHAYAGILGSLKTNRYDRVQGKSGVGSPNMIELNQSIDYTKRISDFAAGLSNSSEAVVVKGGKGDGSKLGSRTDPAVTVIDGDVFYAGEHAKGAGVIIVKEGSTLDIRGSFEFEGLIIVSGKLIGRGNATVWGAVMFTDEYRDDDDSLINKGRPYIYYSKAALDNAGFMAENMLGGGYAVIGIYE